MKKKTLMTGALMLALMTSSSALANEANEEVPLDQGIVVDLNTESSVDVNQLVTDQAEEEASASDGTTLPLEQNSVEVDTGQNIEPTVEVTDPAATAAPVSSPVVDTVVLTEKEQPKVEPLAKTGLLDTSLYVALFVLVIGAAGLFVTKRNKVTA